jgi:hypothetical protein
MNQVFVYQFCSINDSLYYKIPLVALLLCCSENKKKLEIHPKLITFEETFTRTPHPIFVTLLIVTPPLR